VPHRRRGQIVIVITPTTTPIIVLIPTPATTPIIVLIPTTTTRAFSPTFIASASEVILELLRNDGQSMFILDLDDRLFATSPNLLDDLVIILIRANDG
jgi:hypothetical protein